MDRFYAIDGPSRPHDGPFGEKIFSKGILGLIRLPYSFIFPTNPPPLPQPDIYRVNTSFNTIETDDDKITKHISNYKYSILSTNIRSLTRHLTELKTIINNLETDVIALQEIWNPHAGYVNIQNYHKIEMKKREKNAAVESHFTLKKT